MIKCMRKASLFFGFILFLVGPFRDLQWFCFVSCGTVFYCILLIYIIYNIMKYINEHSVHRES